MGNEQRFQRPVDAEHLQAMTPQEFAERTGPQLGSIPLDSPPPSDMPLELIILDSLTDDVESVYTLRSASGDYEPDGLALVGEAFVLDALRELMEARLIEAESEYVVEDGRIVAREPVSDPSTSHKDMKRYWFKLTRSGWLARDTALDRIERYQAAHPLVKRSSS